MQTSLEKPAYELEALYRIGPADVEIQESSKWPFYLRSIFFEISAITSSASDKRLRTYHISTHSPNGNGLLEY
jgi:hypothetical protein